MPRLDEQGNTCPATLAEYRQMCAAVGGEDCRAVKFLDTKIAEGGDADEPVIQPDSQMRVLLMPLLLPEPT